MSGWTPEDLAQFRADGPANLQVIDVWLRPGQVKPFRLAVGDINTLLQYQAMQRNTVLEAALEASPPDPPEADTSETPRRPVRERSLFANLGAIGELFDSLAAAAFVAPRYVPLKLCPPDGTRPPEGLWLHDFPWAEQVQLIKLMQGDMSDLDRFRPRPRPGDSAAPTGEGVRDTAEQSPDPASAGAASAGVRSRRPVSRRAGRGAVAADGTGAGAADPAA